MSEQLLPCPCCGSEAVLSKYAGATTANCKTCHLGLTAHDSRRAVVKWNRRTQPTTVHTETLRNALARIEELEKDAVRYRWLRVNARDEWYMNEVSDLLADEVQLDRAIDAVLAGKESGQ